MSAPHLPCILLAAGFSRRWGAYNKLLAEIDGVPVVRRTAAALAAGGCEPLTVVTRPELHDELAAALTGLMVERVWVMNPAASAGMGTSVAAGARALAAAGRGRETGFAVCPADLPWLRAETVVALAEAFAMDPMRPLRPTCEGRPGHPVLFPGSWVGQLGALRGDAGARALLEGAIVRALAVSDPGVARDLDRPSSPEFRSGD
ncbi:MAG: NTP transferase domain-containing protein [Opitutales bacterium]